VRHDVSAPEAVIEDACQAAWCQLLVHAGGVNEARTLAWLATTATREARRMTRREMRELPIEIALDERSVEQSPEVLAQHRQQLALVSLLPERQRRVLWMRMLGLSYDEIACRLECTPRTVERQLLRARDKVRRSGTRQ